MLALRLTSGFAAVPHTLVKARKFQNLGYLNINGNKITLTPKGFLISNSIIADLL
jgi:coproporphyrinogen III oxidase-like Fe-S oxidoreductase